MNLLNLPVAVLDRDGTVVVDRPYLGDPAGLEFAPGAIEGLKEICTLGFRFVVITNQSGIGRGLLSLQQVLNVNDSLKAMMDHIGVPLEGLYFCPHSPLDNCECRKPKQGLMSMAAKDLRFDPTFAVVIGDKASDVEFGKNAGAKTILISPDMESGESRADVVLTDLKQAALYLRKNYKSFFSVR